jgi:hypothetical protein
MWDFSVISKMGLRETEDHPSLTAFSVVRTENGTLEQLIGNASTPTGCDARHALFMTGLGDADPSAFHRGAFRTPMHGSVLVLQLTALNRFQSKAKKWVSAAS